jgi:hypothetical protein
MTHEEDYAALSHLVYGVWGDTEADKIRHSQARIHFLTLLSSHIEKEGLFARWTTHIGIVKIAQDCKQAVLLLQRLKNEAAPEQSISIAQIQANNCLKDFLATRHDRLPLIAHLSEQYITQQIGVSWDWLSIELTRMWFVAIWGWVNNERYVANFRYAPPHHPAPAMEYHFETKPEETYEEMLARFKEETSKIWKEHNEQYKKLYPKGKLLGSQDVKRDVEWFFRLKVLKEAERHIAHHDINGKRLNPPFARKTIFDQVKIVEQLLNHGFTKEKLLNLPMEE